MKYKKLSNKVKHFLIVSVLAMLIAGCSNKPESRRVILIGIDGMGVSDLQNAHTPTLDKLIQSGALSLNTRGVMPTVSGPNWSSHLLGTGPEQHGITSNGWTVDNHSVEPTECDEGNYFPSLFYLIHQQRPDAKSAFFYDWDALANFYNLKTINKVEFSKDFYDTFKKAFPWIKENNPLFSFIYIGHPDETGHSFGWGSTEYLKALEDVDTALGKFFVQLQDAGMFDDTHFVVVTDHGGVGYGHGGLSMEEIEIPWMISGPGVIQDRLVEQPNSVVNTSPTIAWLLGLTQPESWTGRPLKGAFEFSDKSLKNHNSYIPQPQCSLEDGIYFQTETVTITSPWSACDIRFTRNGKEPTVNDPKYKSPLLLDRSLNLKMACFKGDKKSRTVSLDFTKVIMIETVEIDMEASGKYLGKGSFGLINTKTASNDYLHNEWMGFEEVSPTIKLKFNELKSIRRVRLGYLDDPYSWIFAPIEIRLEASVDNNKFVSIKTLSADGINEKGKYGRNWAVLNFEPIKAKAIRIYVKSQGQCPQGHSGEGESAWLFLDEIIVE